MNFGLTKPLRILIVEDDPTSRTLLEGLLSKLPLPISEIKMAKCLKAALEFRADNFDIVLLDLNLPDSQGLDTLAKTNQGYPCTAIVVITGEYDEKIGLKAVAGGAQEYLIKGKYDIYTLSRSIHYAIERKKTEQKQAELLRQLESANQELKSFAYVVSHDLKAPLRGISTLVQWIITDYADKFDENGRKQVDLLLSRVNRMHNLIEGVLQYSRIGRANEKKVRVDLNNLVSETIDMVAPPGNITITIESQLPVIECEQTRIMQVFQNLISNAVKYTDKPKGRIRIGCIKENGFWRFSIADNGPGIEEKHYERIFQIFQTLKPRDEFESTGVGLTVAKKIVEMYGGRIWVESKIGEGSTFFFTLSRSYQAAADKKQTVTAAP